MNNKEKGDLGEKLAREYLIKNKFDILDSNYKAETGEIDIVSKYNDEIIFVEVKSRNSINYGYPSEAINSTKKSRIINTAKYYILEKNIINTSIRFDVIEVYLKKNKINHIENAFCGGDYA